MPCKHSCQNQHQLKCDVFSQVELIFHVFIIQFAQSFFYYFLFVFLLRLSLKFNEVWPGKEKTTFKFVLYLHHLFHHTNMANQGTCFLRKCQCQLNIEICYQNFHIRPIGSLKFGNNMFVMEKKSIAFRNLLDNVEQGRKSPVKGISCFERLSKTLWFCSLWKTEVKSGNFRTYQTGSKFWEGS